MATLENFDARSLALDFSPLLQIKQALDQNRNREFAEKQLALREEIQRGNLGIAEADLILRQDAAQLERDKLESAGTNQQSIQDTLSQLINPPAQEPQIVPGQIIEENVGEFPAPVVRPSPEVDLQRREELLLKLSGIKGGPAIVKSIEPLLKSRDMRAKLALQKEIEDKQRFALSLSRMDRGKQDRAIDNEIVKQARTGERDPFLAELRNMNDADREQELFLDIAQGDVLKDLAKNELVPQETFATVLDTKGNIVGQRSSLTGEVKTDPRTIKPPTKTSIEKNLDAAGITDPEVRKDIIVKSLTKPAVKVDINKGLSFKVPNGFMLLDENDPTKGVTPIPGGPKDTVTGENAGKVQMLRTAQKAFKGVRELVFDFDKKGNITGLQNINLFNANIGVPFTGIQGVPFTDGDKLRAKMEFGIQGITRIETGAAMPDNELDNTRTRFMPKVTDTLEIAQLKLDMYEDFINGTIQLFDPSGRFSSERFDAEFNLRAQGGKGAQAPGTKQTTPQTTQPQRNIAVDF